MLRWYLVMLILIVCLVNLIGCSGARITPAVVVKSGPDVVQSHIRTPERFTQLCVHKGKQDTPRVSIETAVESIENSVRYRISRIDGKLVIKKMETNDE